MECFLLIFKKPNVWKFNGNLTQPKSSLSFTISISATDLNKKNILFRYRHWYYQYYVLFFKKSETCNKILDCPPPTETRGSNNFIAKLTGRVFENLAINTKYNILYNLIGIFKRKKSLISIFRNREKNDSCNIRQKNIIDMMCECFSPLKTDSLEENTLLLHSIEVSRKNPSFSGTPQTYWIYLTVKSKNY